MSAERKLRWWIQREILGQAQLVAVLGIEGIEFGVALIAELLDVFAEGGDGHGEAVDEERIDEHDQFGGAIADNQLIGADVEDGGQILLAHDGSAGRIRLDEIGEILFEIAQHLGRGIVRIGDEAEVDDVARLFVADQIGERGRMRRLVKKMALQFACRCECAIGHPVIPFEPLVCSSLNSKL